MTADPDLAALAYEAARRALADFWWEVGRTMNLNIAERITAGAGSASPLSTSASGKAVDGNLSAAPSGDGAAKAPPPADGPGIVSLEGAKAMLDAAQDRADAAQGEHIINALKALTLPRATTIALLEHFRPPAGVSFGNRGYSLTERLLAAGTIAVGRFARTRKLEVP